MATNSDAVAPIRVYLKTWLLVSLGGGLAGALTLLALFIVGAAQSPGTAWYPGIFVFGAGVAGVFGLAIGAGAGLLGSVSGLVANRAIRRSPVEAVVVAVGGAIGAVPGVLWMVSVVAFSLPIALAVISTLAAAGTLGVWALTKHREFKWRSGGRTAN
jgi:hypothetical protein